MPAHARSGIRCGSLAALALGLLAATPGRGLAQVPAGVLLGRVTDSAGVPVPFAAVAILSANLRVTADSNGRFRFERVPAGPQAVAVRAFGWKPILFMITMGEGEEQTFQVGLERAPQLMPELIAKGRRSAKPPEYAFTTRYDGFFHRRRVRSGTFRVRGESIWLDTASRTADMLRGIPGVRVATSGVLSSVSFLGCHGKVAVWIDGARVMTDDHNDALDFVAPSDVEMVEVYRRAGQIPAEFLEDACAAVVIWTRVGH